MNTRARCLASTVVAVLLSASPSRADDEEVLVLTALPVTYSIASALAKDTRIRVENVPERGRPMNALVSLLEQRADRFAEDFANAAAVVTIGKLWRADPLYTAARGENIRVVDIDATKPWSTSLEGVSVAMEPGQDAPWSGHEEQERSPSVFFWLSPANGARAAEIVAADLKRLVPGDAAVIERNLTDYRRALLDLKLEYEVKLATLPDVTVYALASEFVYLTSDMGLFVDGYFIKQDIDWTDEDLTALGAHLADREIRVVVHKWEPDARIVEAIERAGATLVALDPLDSGLLEDGELAKDGYRRILRANLEALFSALSRANR